MADGRFTYGEIFRYLDLSIFPVGFGKNEKLALRKRSKFFQVVDGILHYVGGKSGELNKASLACNNNMTCLFFFFLEKKEAPRLVIEDKEKRKKIISSIHDTSHLGIHRTKSMITSKYYWPGMSKDIADYVSVAM